LAKTLYFDCFSGASGDMVLGALLDLGLPLDDLRGALGSLALQGIDIGADRVLRAGVSATKLRVADSRQESGDIRQQTADRTQDTADRTQDTGHRTQEHEGHGEGGPGGHGKRNHHHHGHDHGGAHSHHHDHHSLEEIAVAIGRSALSPESRGRAIHMFERLAEAEAAIHAMPVEKVHLHEVGALDSIIDIVGSVYGLDQLGTDAVASSPLNVGGGTVTCAHGVFPVPAPATARLLQGVPIYSGDVQMELVTPTGALIVTEYAKAYGPLPAMTIDRIGYGAGDRDPKRHPNVLRLLLGKTAATSSHRVVEIVCEIDDMNPQLFGPLMDRLLAAGAVDVFYAAVQMKKNRPGTLVTVLAPPDKREMLSGILFAETTTIGVRYQEMTRDCLEREIVTVETPLGAIRFKVARRAGQVLNASPEFDDCARIATARSLPVKEVQAVAMTAWMQR
jgi:pyridinium-3,5-bisthiocarboxylic acid mononucleotide nickel chelatase